jgi:hypothetical protein
LEGERSPIIDIVDDTLKAPLLEASSTSSSSDTSSGGVGSDEDEAEDTMDLCKPAQSYDFGASSVTVGRIW